MRFDDGCKSITTGHLIMSDPCDLNTDVIWLKIEITANVLTNPKTIKKKISKPESLFRKRKNLDS